MEDSASRSIASPTISFYNNLIWQIPSFPQTVPSRRTQDREHSGPHYSPAFDAKTIPCQNDDEVLYSFYSNHFNLEPC